ncbi:MAG TPA: helix-turn-helix domain-containing protein [Candidatus Nanoarchaeia archaeon]|nr:helix-turn-helix domain-containing protein [Candidatus Nanoarchaeia archaeon]
MDCTIYKTLELIGSKWSLLIILSIYKTREKRFSGIKKDLKEITSKILSTRLKELEKEGLVKRRIDASTNPISVYYSLTQSGFALTKIIQDVKNWGLQYKFKDKECQAAFCKNCID